MPTAATFELVKSIHVGCVVLSGSGFVARGGLMLADSPLLRARVARVAPHVVDTLLLASALWLAWAIDQYPFVDAWLTAKVLGLVAYVALGSVALKRGRSKAVRAAAFFGALAVFGYIVSVALTRDAAGAFALLAGR